MNPLQILSGIAGTIGQVGGSGALGNTAGMLEGEQLKRQYASQDLNDRMKMLKILQEQQQMQQPVGFGPGTRVWDPVQGKFIDTVPFAPRPMMNLGPGHTAHDPAGIRPDFTAPPLPPVPPRPMMLPRGGKIVNPITGETIATGEPHAEAAERQPTETQFWASIGAKVASGQATEIEKSLWETRKKVAGSASTRPIILGPNRIAVDPVTKEIIARGPAAPGGAGGEKERVTTETRYVPGKEIKAGTDDYKKIQATLPDAITELTGFMGAKKINFNTEDSAYFTLPSGRKMRKEDAIRDWMKARYGVEVSVRWDPPVKSLFGSGTPGQFVIVKASTLPKREPMTRTVTTGPVGSAKSRAAAESEEPEGDEEE